MLLRKRRGSRELFFDDLSRNEETTTVHEIPDSNPDPEIVVLGKPRALNPATQEQFFLIGREAIINALRHSRSTTIEIEVQYLRNLLCLLVRDNGCGINPDEILRVRDSHWGLRRMRNRAENIGARFGIWSRRGAGTEVRVAMPVDVTNRRSLIHIVSMCFGWRNRR